MGARGPEGLIGKRFSRAGVEECLSDPGEDPKRDEASLASFRLSKGEVIELLGRPTESGYKEKNFPAWIRYDFAGYVIHLEFSDAGSSITRITPMTHEAAEGEI